MATQKKPLTNPPTASQEKSLEARLGVPENQPWDESFRAFLEDGLEKGLSFKFNKTYTGVRSYTNDHPTLIESPKPTTADPKRPILITGTSE